jgi:hypothetical protein
MVGFVIPFIYEHIELDIEPKASNKSKMNV